MKSHHFTFYILHFTTLEIALNDEEHLITLLQRNPRNHHLALA